MISMNASPKMPSSQIPPLHLHQTTFSGTRHPLDLPGHRVGGEEARPVGGLIPASVGTKVGDALCGRRRRGPRGLGALPVDGR